MPESFTNGYALLIGVDASYVDEWALPDVANDLAALEEVLTHPGRCAYLKDRVKTLTGQQATRQGILDGLDWLRERVQADAGDNATAIVYFTGHGWQDEGAQPPEFYLIPYDIRAGQIRSRALRAGDFAEAVGELRPQRLLVVLDCCHAAGMGVKDLRLTAPAGYVGAAMAPTLLMEGGKAVAGPGAKGLDTLTQGRGRAVLSSSTGEQLSWLRRDGTMSIFTYHLIEALTGHARPQEGASEVLVSDVMSHVWRRVPQSARADWDEDQTPDYQVSGNFPVALLLGGKGLCKGQPAPDPLESIASPSASKEVHRVDTGGGAYIGGNVTAGGNFVGRDQRIVYGDEVHGDKTIQSFDTIYQKINARPDDPDLDKQELTETVQKIQRETAQGEEANPNKVERWLKTVSLMAPDIFEVTVACLTNPAAGVATVIRKVAEKAKEEAGLA